ncbi:MAG: methyl-accepting chemotaxis protein [Roseiarcus sp.]
MAASSPAASASRRPPVSAARGLTGAAGALFAIVASAPVAGALGLAIAAQRETAVILALAGALPAAIAGAIGVLIVRRAVATPLRALADGLAGLAAGEARPIDCDAARGDEIGALARAYADLRRVALEAEAAGAAARGREARIEAERARAQTEHARAEQRKARALTAMVEQVESETHVAVNDLIDLMDQMTQITAEMSGAADRLGTTTGAVASGSREALASMQSAAASTKALTASMAGVADEVRGAKATSDEAVLASRAASATIEALSRVAAEIDEITGLIAHVARQTGLLAVNAGVEAARAGSEGLGFALIAREVRSLAGQASGATGRIGRLIGEVQGSTQGAVAAVDAIAKAIDRVSQASESIANAIRGQVGTTRLIAADVDGTTRAVTKVTDQIEIVAADVQGAHELARIVEDACSEAAERVRALQSNLVRIVRTSSVAVDRRAHERHEIDALGAIDVGGEVTPIRILDLSEGGAKLTGAVDPGAQAFILIAPGIDMPLRSRVVRRQGEAVHVSFDIPDEGRARLRALISQAALAAARAPARSAA